MYNILSIQTHNIRNIFLTKRLIVWTTLFLFWWRKLVPKKFVKKMENNLTLEKVLLVCNKNAELLRLVGTTFDFKVAFLRSMRKKNFIILKSLQKKVYRCFVLFVCHCWHLSCQILIESVRKIVIYSLNILMAVLYLKFFSKLYKFAFLLSNN